MLTFRKKFLPAQNVSKYSELQTKKQEGMNLKLTKIQVL